MTTGLPPLVRRAERREDDAYLALAATRADALVVPVHGLRVLVADAEQAPRALVLARAAVEARELLWLGELGGAPCFAVEVADPLVVHGGRWSGLRPVLPQQHSQPARSPPRDR